MGMTIAQKILKAHLVDGEMVVGQEIGLRIDQTLTQDATGTMAYLQFEAMGVDQVKTERSVAYIDHNTLQSGFENADDHKYIGSVARKHGIYYSILLKHPMWTAMKNLMKKYCTCASCLRLSLLIWTSQFVP